MNTSRIYAIFIRQIYLIKSNPARLASNFLWIIINILMWGFISKYLGTFGGATFSLVTVLLGAIILWDFLGRMEQGIMFGFFEDVWSQNFINYFASPLKVKEYLTGLVVTSVITGIIGFFITIVLAAVAFGYNFFRIGLMALPFIAVLFVFGTAVGIFVAALIFRYGPSAEWVGWPIPFVLSIFSGVYYPVSTLPISFQWISKAIPSSYVFEGLRMTLNQSSVSLPSLIFATLLAFVYLFGTYLYFLYVYRYNLKSGGISRFSAEG